MNGLENGVGVSARERAASGEHVASFDECEATSDERVLSSSDHVLSSGRRSLISRDEGVAAGLKISRRGKESSARLRLRLLRLRVALRRARRLRSSRASAVCLVALFASGALVALGCGWDGFEDSVRFNLYSTDRERERMPPLPFKLRTEDARGEAAKRKADEGNDYEAAEREKKETNALWSKARAAVERARLLVNAKAAHAGASEDAEAGGALRQELESVGSLLKEYAVRGDDAERLNSAADQLDALSALDKGSSPEHVLAYLEARRAYDDWRSRTQRVEAQTPRTQAQQGEESKSKEVDENRSEGVDENRSEAGENKSGVVEEDGSKEEHRASSMENWAEEVEARLSTIERDRELADNAAYLRAVGIYRAGQEGDAVEAFASVAARYPRGEKREAALFMAGRASMEESDAYLAGQTATSEEPCVDCRDDAWRTARAYFSRLVREYPRGRLAGEARGWLAYLSWRVGDKADALACYYRMLGDEEDADANAEALMSLKLTRGLADESDMARVETTLSAEPKVALAYAYHEIYNYPGSYSFDTSLLSGEPSDDSSDSETASADSSASEDGASQSDKPARRRGLARIARFATQMIERYAGASIGGAFTVRVAEADLELGDDRAALSLARRALAQGLKGSERAGALWCEGVAEYRLHDLASSRGALALLVREFPGGDVETRARRLLAVASEEAGDMDSALEQYLALRYDADVAYFVDVLMTPEQLASFVERHESLRERDLLTYSLGVRYLRAGRYTDARATFARVRTMTEERTKFYEDDETNDNYAGIYEKDNPPADPKYHTRYSYWGGDYGTPYHAGDGGARDTGVFADWVLKDTETVADLERLEREAALAEGDEAKAEALYQLASYIYEGSDLKFYNPVLWRGMRSETLAYFNEEHYRLPGEAQRVWLYMQEHETAARALVIFLDVARRFPRTRAARDALYTAVVCHQHLSNYNGYWRQAYADGLHAGDRMVTYEDVRRTYPDYRVPIGTNGWQPSTRTINGHAAWPAPTKPKPLTGAERARLKIERAAMHLSQAWALFGRVGGGRALRWTLAFFRWLVAALVGVCVMLVFRSTRRTRRFLYRQLVRRRRPRRAARAREVYAPKSSYAAHVPYSWGESLRAAASETAHCLTRLALHERARAALVLNLFTHGLLTLLVWAVLWAARGG